jgi:hypothetical protein
MQISEQHRRERASRLTFELQPMDSRVKVILTHEEFESQSPTFETTQHGWPAIMSSLKSLLETGSPLPFRVWDLRRRTKSLVDVSLFSQGF